MLDINVLVSPLPPAGFALTGFDIKHAQVLVSVYSARTYLNTSLWLCVIRGVVWSECRPVVSLFAKYRTPQNNVNS